MNRYGVLKHTETDPGKDFPLPSPNTDKDLKMTEKG